MQRQGAERTRPRLIIAAVILALSAGCSSDAEPNPTGASPSENASATTATPEASSTEAETVPADDEPFADVFIPTDRFEFEPVSKKYSRTQLAPIQGAIRGIAQIRGANVKRAVALGDPAITVTVVGVKPVEGNTSRDAFAAVMGSLQQRAGDPEEVLEGQAFLFRTSTPAHIYVSPIAVEPYLLLLVTVADPDAPIEALVRHLLKS